MAVRLRVILTVFLSIAAIDRVIVIDSGEAIAFDSAPID
jgi:hypothetical protein